MNQIVKIEQTTWPNLRFVLFRRDDGFYQYVAQHQHLYVSLGQSSWEDGDNLSGLFEEVTSAEMAMSIDIAQYERT